MTGLAAPGLAVANPSECLRLARAAVAAADLEGGIALLAQGLRAAPANGTLRLEHARMLTQAKRLEEAAETLAALAALEPGRAGLAVAQAAVEEKRGHDAQAAGFLALALAAQPGDHHARRSQAQCLRRMGRAEEALAVLEAGLALAPREALLLLPAADILAGLGRHAEASAALDIIAADKPGHGSLPDARVRLAEARGDREGVIAAHRLAYEAGPKDARALAPLVRALRRDGRHAEALDMLRASLAQAPGDVERMLALAGALGAAEEAAPLLAEAARRAPAHPRLPELQAALAEARRDHAGAATALRAALALAPANQDLRQRLLRALLRAGQPEAALEALGTPPAQAAPALLREAVRALLALDRAAEARQAIDAAALRAPGQPPILAACILLAEHEGDRDAAIRLRGEALSLQPGDEGMRVALAEALSLRGDTEEALALVDAGLATHPASAALGFARIAVLRHEGLFEAAEASWADLAARHPAHPDLWRIRGELATAAEAHDLAVAHFTEGLRRAAESGAPDAWRLRARLVGALRRLHDLEGVARILREPARDDPALRLELLGELLMLGEWDEAGAIIAAWAPESPAEAILKLQAEAQLAALMQDHARALTLAGAILEQDPAHEWAGARRVAWLGACFRAQEAHAAHRAQQPLLPPTRRKGALRSSAGHIVNEMRLRPAETQALAEAHALPGKALLETAAARLLADGESTGAALGVFLGAWRAGRIRHRAGMGGAGAIPRAIHQYWDQPQPPPDIAAMMDRLRALHPGHAHHQWNDGTARAFLKAHAAPEVLEAYHLAPHVAVRSDIFRLAVLVAEGGIHMDADDHCRRDLLPFLPEDARLVVYQEDVGSLGNNFIAAAPGHPALRQALLEATRAVLEGAGESPWLATGPGLLTRVVGRMIAAEPGHRLPEGLQVQPLRAYRQHVTPHRYLAYKRTALHWSSAL